MDRPLVGVGILVINQNGEVLLGERNSSHGSGKLSPPGGHLERGESFEGCASRELFEETGLLISNFSAEKVSEGLRFEYLWTTNDIMKEEGKHYVTIFMLLTVPILNILDENSTFSRENDSLVIWNKEPEKCNGWHWFNLKDLHSEYQKHEFFIPFQNLLRSGKVPGTFQNYLLDPKL